jgi:hypothetical protein
MGFNEDRLVELRDRDRRCLLQRIVAVSPVGPAKPTMKLGCEVQ